MLSFWAGGISSFPPCTREYRLLRRLKHLESVLMNFYHWINILIKLLKKFHPELERSESLNHAWTEIH